MEDHYIIVEGIHYRDALNKALEKMGLKEEQLVIEILEEKKASLFKKGYVQLKVSAKQEEVPHPTIEEKQVNTAPPKVNSMQVGETVPFDIDFRPDGVYLTVFSTGKSLGPTQLLEKIVAYLNMKQIQDYELSIIKECVDTEGEKVIKIAPQQEEVLIDSEVHIEVAPDKMQAWIVITKPYGGRLLTAKDVKEALAQRQIVYGIDQSAIEEAINKKSFNVKHSIAKGKEPTHGVDAKLIYHIDIELEKRPQILEDGTVNFKELNLIKNVEKGQLLLEVVPATEGIPGQNVLGQEVPAKKGKMVVPRLGKNTVITADGLKVYAAASGQVYVTIDGKINVSEVYEIMGNVDHSTGNINFNGSVVIRGNVKAGFTVEAEGTVEVYGVVEGAVIKARGDIIIGRGVQGNNQAYLECTGNLVAKYIENAILRTSGSIEADCILHSDVVAASKVVVSGKKGLLVGGDVRAGEEVRAKILGSPMGTITKIEVGSDPAEKIRSEEIKKEIGNIEKNLDQLQKTIELLHRMNKANQLPQNKQEILVKSIRTYEVLKQNHTQLTEELKQVESRMQSLSKGKVHCSHTIHPGVRITILNSTRHIYDSLTNCTLSRKDGEITIGPYEK